jgi:hypothetical protein
MEPNVSLHKYKSNKPFPIRILKVDTICIDEEHNLSSSTSSPEPAAAAAAETHILTSTEKADLDTLFESYRAYVAAKNAYESAANAFWKSPTGMKLETILAPDPPASDRTPLNEKTRALESRLAAICIQIKHRHIEISGYNYVVAKYTILMFETQTLPRVYSDFVLHTFHERILDEIPKLWTNKVTIQRKKIVDCVYVYGHVLPPYRLKDME